MPKLDLRTEESFRSIPVLLALVRKTSATLAPYAIVLKLSTREGRKKELIILINRHKELIHSKKELIMLINSKKRNSLS